MKEELRIIKEFTEYMASNTGDIYSLYDTSKRRRLEPYKLKPFNKGGYGKVELNGMNRHVSRLVLETFCPWKEGQGKLCLHNDGNPGNNHISNLRWGTAKENSEDMVKHGTVVKGEKVYNCKIRVKDVLDIVKRKKAGEYYLVLANEYGVGISTIVDIIKGRTWTHITKGVLNEV